MSRLIKVGGIRRREQIAIISLFSGEQNKHGQPKYKQGEMIQNRITD
jgi:hypothetical protein